MYVRLSVIVEGQFRLTALCSQCRHFADWLAKMENLGR